MRIVGGAFKGHSLATPQRAGTRPTSDRVREAVFNVLAHGFEGPDIDGANVLDIFAGTGALGLEALSRGAASCLFIETDARARALVRRNIEALKLEGVARLFRRDATNMGPRKSGDAASFVFADPPYGFGLGEQALASLRDGDWLRVGATVVLEERALVHVSWPDRFIPVDERVYGDTRVHFARYMPK